MKKAGLKKGFLITYGIIGLITVMTAIGMSVYQRSQVSADKTTGAITTSNYNSYYGCALSGGTWKSGGTNGCAGYCPAYSEGRMCTMSITDFCDCGVGKCFNPTTKRCESGGGTVTPTPTTTTTVIGGCTHPICPAGKTEICAYSIGGSPVATMAATVTPSSRNAYPSCPTCSCVPTSSVTSTAVPGQKVTEVTLKAKSFTAFNIRSLYGSGNYSEGLEVCNASRHSSASVIYSYPKFGAYEWLTGNADNGKVIEVGVGYYGLNQWNDDVKVGLCRRSTTSSDGQVPVIYPNTGGSWFLLSYGYYETDDALVRYADREVRIAKKGQTTCNNLSCSENKKLGELVAEGRIYDQAYEITDPNGTDPDKTFTLKNLTFDHSGDMNLKTGGKSYWVYVWPE